MKTYRLCEICTIKEKKSLVKSMLHDDDTVSFSGMDQLGIGKKYFEPNTTKSLGSVYSGYVFLRENDLVYAKITPCFENGKMGIAKNLANGVGFGSSEFVPITCGDKVVVEYLYYFLLRPSFISNGKSKMTGASGHRRLPDTYTENLLIPLPSIEDQKKIVTKLDSAFEKIDKAINRITSNIAKSKDFLEASTRRIFELGDTIQTPLDEVTDLTTDYVANGSFASLAENVKYSKEEDYAILLRLLDSSRDFKGPFVYVDKKAYDFLQKSSLESGDIIISNVGARLGTVFRAPDLGRRMTLGPNSILIRSQNHGDYLYVWLRSSAGQNAIKKIVGGAGQPKFNKTDFRKMSVPIPKYDKDKNRIVEDILKVESFAKSLTEHYEDKLKKLESLKKSMLEQAFSVNTVE